MKKGCLIGVAILVICLLLPMCSSETDNKGISTSPSMSNETISSEHTETQTTELLHSHTFNDATCTAPKTCSTCGATEGNPLEHTWVDATCSTPKNCSVCKTTEGDTLEHTWVDATCTTPKTCSVCKETTGNLSPHKYSNGKCKVCKEEDPSDPKNITVWIPTNGGKKYHSRPGCSNMKNPKETTLDKAKKAGYGACGRCH